MERHKRIVAASLAVALLLAACSDGDGAAEGVQPIEEPQADPGEPEPDPVDEDPEPEAEPAPDAEPEPPDIDITVVPDEITEEYVEAVLVELERLYSEAYVLFQATDEPTLEVTDRLGAAFTRSEYQSRLRQFADIAEAGYPGYQLADSAAPRAHKVERILDSSATCVYAETLLDVSGVRVDAGRVQTSFVELGPPDFDAFNQLNSTPWVVHAFPSGDLSELQELRPCG